MQDAMAVLTGQAINQSTLTGRHGSFINETPVPFVEIERFLTGDRVMGIAVPCDQSELGKLPNDEGFGCAFHRFIMPHVHSVFKQRVKTTAQGAHLLTVAASNAHPKPVRPANDPEQGRYNCNKYQPML